VPLLKQSDGKKSASFTMMVIGYAVVTLWLLVSIVEEAFGLKIREFSGTEAMSYLTPLTVLYFGRRWAEKGNTSGTPSIPPPSSEEKAED
ncbi:hypothetical protein EBU71_13660, partial [bacterium]|nr:hypothetical protein [Candidatus Elulimicrobium humile]